jgi:TolB-like protein/DNA-binding winged helix-turn-helix (wHTH) protein/predicted Zn-dependent protease
VALSPTQDTVRFGLFELDLKAGLLSRNGTKIRLPQQPLQLLSILLERPGEILTREELRQRLWSSDVFVDFDHGLNKSIQKLRDSLGDSADSPRYIETIPRVGYRFIAPVNNGIAPPEQPPDIKIPQTPLDLPAAPPPASIVGSRGMLWSLLIACLVLSAGTAAWLIYKKLHATEPIRSLAVLPLDNLSGDPGQNYFADGMTDELTTMLAKNSTLRIVSRTSVMQYKGAHRPLPEIARELGVDGVLEGSIARTGDKVHMTVQLIQAPSDTHLWAESYDRNANDVVTLPKEAAQTIAKRLGKSTIQQPPARYVNPEAHDAYLRGRYIWFKGDNEPAGKYFTKATELQPDYAPGWAGLSSYYGQGSFDDLDPRLAIPQGLDAANKAVELDPSLPWAHLSLGAMTFLNWNWAQAEKEIDHSIELNPDFAEGYHFRAKMLSALGRRDEAIESEKKAMELDPFERPFAMALALVYARRYDAAIDDIRSRLEGTPRDVGLHWMLGETYRRKGQLKEAAKEWEAAFLLGGNKEEAANVRKNYEEGGYKALLLRQLSNLKKKSATRYVSPMQFALQYAQLGRREETLAALEQAYQQRAPYLLWVQNDPAYDFLHPDERYRSIIKRIGLPPAW